MMKRQDYRFFDRLRVRFSEVDSQGWSSTVTTSTTSTRPSAATGARSRCPYAESVAQFGGEFFVRKSTLEYFSPARGEELLDLAVRAGKLGTSSMTLHCALFRGEQVLATGELVYVLAEDDRAVPLPEPLREVIAAFEAGEPVVQVEVGGWNDLGESASAIRTQVFVQEQKIPSRLEWDEADATCLHAVARNRFGAALATGRLLEHVPGVAKIGRMAVLRSMRGSGVGREVLEGLMRRARESGYREVLLHAQLSAVGSICAWASRSAGRCSRRPASATWRWSRRCEAFDVSRADDQCATARAAAASLASLG